MPINVFGNSSHDNNKKNDTSLFVKKPYLRANHIESDIEEVIDLKNPSQFRMKNLPDPSSIREACSKIYVDILFSDPSNMKITAHLNLKDIKKLPTQDLSKLIIGRRSILI